MPTKKQIIDDIIILASRFIPTDDSRLDETYIGFKVEQIRVDLIIKEYNFTGVIDQNWMMDFGIFDMTNVNFADDPNVTFCSCDISKAKIPATINLTAIGDGNLDLGLTVISACGKTKYARMPFTRWRDIPKEHTYSKFSWYDRLGQDVYVNKNTPKKLRFLGIPETTEGLYVKNTLPVTSGSIESGISYTVYNAPINYNGTIYLPEQSFTGVTSVTDYIGSGKVFFTDFQTTMTENDSYPVSAHMARLIVLEFMTKELNIEEKQIADTQNDSMDDATK